jgi:hypothetical protein
LYFLYLQRLAMKYELLLCVINLHMANSCEIKSPAITRMQQPG